MGLNAGLNAGLIVGIIVELIVEADLVLEQEQVLEQVDRDCFGVRRCWVEVLGYALGSIPHCF